MADFILHNNGAYNVWTTICDSVFFDSALTLEQLESYIKEDRGSVGMRELPARLARVHKTGCSAIFNLSLNECVATNQEKLSVEDFISKYVTL